ncbi:hypothetical protein A143_11750 [Vibrio splendidus ZS-139]|nr:hypothetical protein A143_11750 [Vibrio splendidus ZS-139]
MSILIYLDQNTLSDLRQRKIDETDKREFTLLKIALKSPDVIVVYSHVTLSEIHQIPSEQYRDEHITLLDELSAQYIEPLSRNLNNQAASDIWVAYLDNIESNKKMGISDLMDVSQLSSRKMAGLPIEDSFDAINEKVKLVLDDLISNCEQQLASIDVNTLDEPSKENFLNMTLQLPKLKEKSAALEAPKVDSSHTLGPKSFRDIPELKALEITKLPVTEVVKAIESTFSNENSNFNWRDYFDDTPQNAVARAYSLMNWAGYHADDFDKVKKRSDRFNASNNDMQHAVCAIGVNFLLSRDNAFLKKAEACYAYINQGSIVCSPEYFLSNHCKFV